MSIQCVQVVGSIEDESAGPSYSVVRLAEALAARGSHSVLMSLSDSSGDTCSKGVRFRRFLTDAGPLPLPRQIAPSRTMARAIASAAAEGAVMHTHGLWRMPNVYPGLAARRTGTPFVVAPRGMLGPAALQFSRRQKQLFWHLFQKRALASVTCFHATAVSELEDIRAFGLKAPVAVIPNGIDVTESLEMRWRRGTKPRQVLYLGRLHAKKGIDRLLHAWSKLDQVNMSWELRIVGPSERGHLQELEKLARKLDLVNVCFDGPLHGLAKAEAYASADLFVLPTLHENFGMVVAEALSNGTPVISSIGAPWKGLVDERCGWWIEHGVEPLAATLREAMGLSDSVRAEMGARGRAWMERDFSWTAIAEKMDQLYRWCAGNGDQPDFVIT